MTTFDLKADPTFRAFFLLRTVFTIAPIAFGLDKFTNVLTNWSIYLAPWINDIVPGNADQAMYVVGVIEIAAGLLVAVAPRLGAYVVALWLLGIIVDLLTLKDFYDIALRDFGLLVGALALAQLAEGRGLGLLGRSSRHSSPSSSASARCQRSTSMQPLVRRGSSSPRSASRATPRAWSGPRGGWPRHMPRC